MYNAFHIALIAVLLTGFCVILFNVKEPEQQEEKPETTQVEVIQNPETMTQMTESIEDKYKVFDTMSEDWGSDDLEGFVFCDLPEKYADNALAPQDRQILFGQLYENGFLVKTADDKAPEVAVGWRERKLNGKYDFKWLYAGKFAEGISEEASTKEGKLSPTTKSVKGSFYERSLDNAYEISVDESNLVTEDTKAAEAIKNWFSKVQEKNGGLG